jgi:hypothetical protein
MPPADENEPPLSLDDFQSDLPHDLQDGLIAVGEAARDLREPWWIFGGAAMALYGLTDLHVPDIDVLCAPRDARALLAALDGQVVADPGEGLFRSAVFGRAPDQPILVEVMADLETRDGAEWRPVAFTARAAGLHRRRPAVRARHPGPYRPLPPVRPPQGSGAGRTA